ncbi:MAG TPA: hypothetical protein VGG87_06600 [Solirubrobacteraceae bacterium]|jgi:hypothetical protein
MSEEHNPPAAEDLDVETSEAASVAGGRANVDPGDEGAYNFETEMASLQAKGYVEAACMTEGSLMINPKTNHKVMVKLV